MISYLSELVKPMKQVWKIVGQNACPHFCQGSPKDPSGSFSQLHICSKSLQIRIQFCWKIDRFWVSYPRNNNLEKKRHPKIQSSNSQWEFQVVWTMRVWVEGIARHWSCYYITIATASCQWKSTLHIQGQTFPFTGCEILDKLVSYLSIKFFTSKIWIIPATSKGHWKEQRRAQVETCLEDGQYTQVPPLPFPDHSWSLKGWVVTTAFFWAPREEENTVTQLGKFEGEYDL